MTVQEIADRITWARAALADAPEGTHLIIHYHFLPVPALQAALDLLDEPWGSYRACHGDEDEPRRHYASGYVTLERGCRVIFSTERVTDPETLPLNRDARA